MRCRSYGRRGALGPLLATSFVQLISAMAELASDSNDDSGYGNGRDTNKDHDHSREILRRKLLTARRRLFSAKWASQSSMSKPTKRDLSFLQCAPCSSPSTGEGIASRASFPPHLEDACSSVPVSEGDLRQAFEGGRVILIELAFTFVASSRLKMAEVVLLLASERVERVVLDGHVRTAGNAFS